MWGSRGLKVASLWARVLWLDHLVSTEDGNCVIINMSVLYGPILSDHIPVMVDIDLQLAPDIDHGTFNDVRCKIDWSAQNKNVLFEYGVQTEYLLKKVEIPTDVLLCKDCNCSNVVHKVALQKYYDNIMCAITTASQNSIKINKPSKGKIVNLPGWKEFAFHLYANVYAMSRETYTMWKNAGRLRQGPLSDMKNRAKARFKGAMRFIRSNEDALRKESLAKMLLCKNDKAFWKEIKLMNNCNLSLPNVVDGVTG